MKVYTCYVHTMPESCAECPFASHDADYNNVCLAIEDEKKRILGCEPKYMAYRRHDCPLESAPRYMREEADE